MHKFEPNSQLYCTFLANRFIYLILKLKEEILVQLSHTIDLS